jgi:hypothetical protein
LKGSENVVCSGAERVRTLKGVSDRSYTHGFGDPLFEGQCKGAAAEFNSQPHVFVDIQLGHQ